METPKNIIESVKKQWIFKNSTAKEIIKSHKPVTKARRIY